MQNVVVYNGKDSIIPLAIDNPHTDINQVIQLISVSGGGFP